MIYRYENIKIELCTDIKCKVGMTENQKKERNGISIARQHCGFARRIVEVGDVTHDGPGAHRQVVDQAGASWPVSGKLGGTGQEKNKSRNQFFKKKSWDTLWLNTLIIKIRRVKLRTEEQKEREGEKKDKQNNNKTIQRGEGLGKQVGHREATQVTFMRIIDHKQTHLFVL